MTRSVAAHQLDPVPAAIKVVGKKAHQRLVSRIVNGRRRYFNFKFLADGRSDFIGRRAGLQLDREQNAVGLRSNVVYGYMPTIASSAGVFGPRCGCFSYSVRRFST